MASSAAAAIFADPPAIFSPADAATLRGMLGSSNAKDRRVSLNNVIKFTRKASTHSRGEAAILEWDLSHVDEWRVPTFRRHGKGQAGDFDPVNLMAFNWRAVLSQLPDEKFEEIFGLDPRTCGVISGESKGFALAGPGVARGDVLKVAMVAVGEAGRPFVAGAAEFQLRVWTRCAVYTLRAGYKGDLAMMISALDEVPTMAGPGPEWQGKGQRKWHSPGAPPESFLVGGFDDRRAAHVGEGADSWLVRFPACVIPCFV